jgi:ABC-type branched-subunit amino acid transport system ATPase component
VTDPTAPAPTGAPALTVEDVTVRFGDVVAVDGVSLRVPLASCRGLIGPNGSGKTSLLNAVSGFVPARGRVQLDGAAIRSGRPRSAVRAGLARTFQTPQMFANLTARENLFLGMRTDGACGLGGAWLWRWRMHRGERHRREISDALLARVGLGQRGEVLAGQLAYGEQRRLELARALATEPRMVLLDEPAAGLNQTETTQFAAIIEGLRADGIGFFLVEHKLDFVRRLCDGLSVLALGRIIADGAPDEVLADRAVMDAYLGVRSRA